jgi:hypothetical protein
MKENKYYKEGKKKQDSVNPSNISAAKRQNERTVLFAECTQPANQFSKYGTNTSFVVGLQATNRTNASSQATEFSIHYPKEIAFADTR